MWRHSTNYKPCYMLHSNIHNYISRPGLPNDERRRACMCVYVCVCFCIICVLHIHTMPLLLQSKSPCIPSCKPNWISYSFFTLSSSSYGSRIFVCALVECKKQCHLIPFFSLIGNSFPPLVLHGPGKGRLRYWTWNGPMAKRPHHLYFTPDYV